MTHDKLYHLPYSHYSNMYNTHILEEVSCFPWDTAHERTLNQWLSSHEAINSKTMTGKAYIILYVADVTRINAEIMNVKQLCD